MKKILSLLLLAPLFAGCDDPVTPNAPGDNANGNRGRVEQNAITYRSDDGNVQLSQRAQRLEMPALRGGTNNLFVVHTTGGKVNYAIEYDQNKRASRWTAYATYKGWSSNENYWNRNNWYGATWNGLTWSGDPFQPDPLIPKETRTTLDDHSRNGHDRGHMLGSADRLNSMEANGQTFYLSNMHPQLAGFNQRGIWYNLEGRLRSNYDRDDFRDTLYIVKGGTIDANYHTATGRSGRALIVPDYFYMALLCKNRESSQGGYKAIAFWMKHEANTRNDYASFAISIDELEKKTGLDFFCNLPDELEDVVERNLVLSAWKL